VNVTNLDDASFTSGDFCASGVNTISGVVTPGGTFSIQSQTGSGGVTIAAGTGVLSNYFGGDQVTIEYTTPAGGCQNSSTVVVNVLAADDATFNYSAAAYCVDASDPTPTITGLAGGAFSSTVGLVINAGTGEIDVSASTPGAYTVTYTTTGPCPNASNVAVTINDLPIISAVSPVNICAPNDAVLDATAPGAGYVFEFFDPGMVSLGSGTVVGNNSTLTVTSPAAGSYNYSVTITDPLTGCSSSATILVNVNTQDNASFNYASAVYCQEAADPTPTVIGLAGGTFSSTAGLSINAGTGEIDLSASTPGAYTVTYTTAGPCPNSSNVSVTINATPTISGPTSVCPGETIGLSGSGTPDGTTPWTSSAPGFATVDNAGNVTGVSPGITTITYLEANGCSGSYSVTVIAAPDITPIGTIASCDSVQLPAITGSNLSGAQAYYDGVGGTGTMYNPGDWITSSTTLYAYDSNSGCSDEETVIINVQVIVAAFTANPTSGCAIPHTVFFTDNSVMPDTWFWDFGDANTSTLQNPVHNYTAFGTFTVTLTVTDTITGCSDQTTGTITVNTAPLLDPVANIAGCDSIQLPVIAGTGLTGNESYYSGTGGTGTQYAANDWISSSMTMYVNDISNPCTVEQSFTITVNSSPTISGGTVVCASSVLTLTGTGTPDPVTPWSSSNTGVATVDNAGNVTGIAAGTSDITYTDINGCSNTVTITVNATPTISGNAPICVAATNTLTGSGTPNATTPWTSSDPTVATIDNAGVVTAVASGTTTITYLDANGCSTTEVVTVNAAPNLVITDPVAVCAPLTVDITDAAVTAGSDPGTLTYWTDNLATITLATPNAVNTTNAYYIQLDDGNCTAIQPVNVTVNPAPTIALTDPAPVCDPALVDLTDAAVTTGSDPGTFTYFDGMGTAVPTPTAVGSGMYFITLTDGNGCQSAGQVTATVNPTPNLVVTDPSPVCEPNTVDLTAAIVTAGSDPGTLTYWIDAGATATLSTPTGVLTGMYYIQLEDGNGCSLIASVNATVDPLDDASFFLNPTCDGATATLTGTAGGTFSLLTATSATIDPTTGTVTGASYNEALDIEYATTGICPNNSVELVIVDDCTPEELIIPTAFTPGSDGAHDTWEIVGLDNVYPNSRVTVYNRWGNKVFEHNASSSDPYNNNMWDGTFNGAQLPVASYYYIIETNDASSTEKYEGTVTILQ
ncbi:gliding motility-associated C-terminal domain-containing protein, partial [Crocinitomicaceae bacterium]|nr:gliding motility-associated C-terminal domain-containing protein [Crocinitomicaceae bacterium]